MPEGRRAATPGHRPEPGHRLEQGHRLGPGHRPEQGDRLAGEREAAIRHLGRSTTLPAARRLLLVEELAGDVEGLAARLEAQGQSPAEARHRALELLAPSPEAVHALERLHGTGRGRQELDNTAGSGAGPSGRREGPLGWNRIPARGRVTIIPALAVGALLPWALPSGTRAAAVPMAVAVGLALLPAAAVIRQGWFLAGEDQPTWRRSLRLHLASLVVLWAGTLLAGAGVVHRWMVALGREAPWPAGDGAAGSLAALLHPLLVLCVLATALTLAAVIHLTLLVPRVAGSQRARDAVEELIQVLLGRSR